MFNCRDILTKGDKMMFNNVKYAYKVIDIDCILIERIKSKLDGGKHFIETSHKEENMTHHLAWIKSFYPIIKEIDPLAETPINPFDSTPNSLLFEWYRADETSGPLVVRDREIFTNYLSILHSLLDGKAKIVSDERGIQKDARNELLVSFNVSKNIKVIDNFVFVLMPFTEKWSKYIWENQIKIIVESIKNPKLICKRADDLYGKDVMVDIIESIILNSQRFFYLLVSQ